jgi:polygalacturonase
MKTLPFHLLLAICLAMLPAHASELLQPKAPVIPQRTFAVTDFSAVGDGSTMNTAAFRKAVDACTKAGGGRVVVPAGDFLCGPFELATAVDLHLMKGAIIRMSQQFDDYPVTKNDRQGFITATAVHDVQISGEGTIDGQGESWWTAFRQTKGTAAAKSEPRRPQMIGLTRCERVRIEGIKTLNPPNTHCSLRQCSEVSIEGLTMTAPGDSPNTDALNLNVRNALIRNCSISTGDDNIVFLASAPAKDGTFGVENIRVVSCTLGVGHGLSVGSYTSGGIRNISVENVSFDGTTAGIRLKAARDRGGIVENLTFRNIAMKNVKNPIYFTSYYPKEPARPDEDAGGTADNKIPRWRNITIEGGKFANCMSAMIIWGLPEEPVRDITLRNLEIASERGAVVYHAKGIRFENVKVQAAKGAPLTTFDAEVDGMTAVPFAPPRQQ